MNKNVCRICGEETFEKDICEICEQDENKIESCARKKAKDEDGKIIQKKNKKFKKTY